MTYNKDSIEFQPKPSHVRFKDIDGQIFHRLVVLGFAGTRENGHAEWWCECECKNIVKVAGSKLRNGHTKSCGCLNREPTQYTHQLSGHPLFGMWCMMRTRCFNPNYSRFMDYGGRGIRVCRRWLSFPNFLADMGERPSPKHSIDRINVNGHYSCGKCDECVQNDWVANCRWATPIEQGNNTRRNHTLTWYGRTQTIAQWSRELNIAKGAIMSRLSYGWSDERILTTPPRARKFR